MMPSANNAARQLRLQLEYEYAMSDKIGSYAELRELIRFSLRIQHPEWVNCDGNSPICDFYDARLAKLLGLLPPREDGAELPVGDSVEKAKNKA
jgi:hypothetical protein